CTGLIQDENLSHSTLRYNITTVTMTSSNSSSSGVSVASINSYYCFKNPNDIRCEQLQGFYRYHLSLAANAAFLAIFSLSLLLYLAIYALTRRGLGFTVALSLGIICEILG